MPLAELPGLPTLVFMGALALTIAVVLLRTQRYYARNTSARPSYEPPPRQDPSPRAHTLGAPPPMVDWEVQMHDMARELAAQLDSKIGVLEHLIREADRAAARLEAAVAAQRAGSSVLDAAERLERLTPSAPHETGPPISQAEALKAAGGADRALPAPRAPEQSAGERPPAESRYESIYTLADYGYDPAEIARRTGTPVGEVQLILSLRAAKRRAAPDHEGGHAR